MRGDEGRKLLSGRYDRDPGRWRPYTYSCIVEVPVTEGQWGENTVTIMNQPFVMERINHSVIGNINDYQATGLADDGMYYVEWREENSHYQNQPLLARNAFGTKEYPIALTVPLGFAGNRTLTFRVTNAYTRLLTPDAETFSVELTLHGAADWGPDRSEG
jgi:hypothetical protein